MNKTEHQILGIRRAGVPLCAVETADPGATVQSMVAALQAANGVEYTLLEWDISNGWRGKNGMGKDNLTGWYDAMAQQFPETLKLLGENVPENTVAFVHNVQRVIERDGVIQGLWNLRDTLKVKSCLVVMVGPAFVLPVELSQDVLVITEPLPSEAQLNTIVTQAIKDARAAGARIPKFSNTPKLVETLLGLSAFAAEQALALSIGKDGIDERGLWDRKVKLIEQTPGLSVWKGGETFLDIGGCDNVKGFVGDVLRGRNAPRAICFIDEIEKSIGGAGDLSGVSQDYLKCLLTYMEDTQAAGMIFVGPPGAAKSAVAKAAGNEVGIPTVAVDLGGMKGSLVGQSEQQLRAALKVVDAVSQKRTLFIATCNSLAVLPPELKRRFTLGTFYFDLPTDKERQIIWGIYRKRFEIDDVDLPPEDKDWTGAEVKQCCNIAWRLNKPLRHAAKFIVPVAKSAEAQIKALREQASGKFISASHEGFYEHVEQSSIGRKMTL